MSRRLSVRLATTAVSASLLLASPTARGDGVPTGKTWVECYEAFKKTKLEYCAGFASGLLIGYQSGALRATKGAVKDLAQGRVSDHEVVVTVLARFYGELCPPLKETNASMVSRVVDEINANKDLQDMQVDKAIIAAAMRAYACPSFAR